jgi:hypothetical protein
MKIVFLTLVLLFSASVQAQQPPGKQTNVDAETNKKNSALLLKCRSLLGPMEGKNRDYFAGKTGAELYGILNSLDGCVRNAYLQLPRLDLAVAAVATGYVQAQIDEQALATVRSTFSQEQVSFTCEKSVVSSDPKYYDKVKLYLETGENDPPELVSAIRQRFRSMSDVELVYLEEESDFVVDVLATQGHTTSGQPLGYSVSIVTALPCEWRIGTTSKVVKRVQNHYILGSGNLESAIEAVISRLDSQDIEHFREMHSITRRYNLEKKP